MGKFKGKLDGKKQELKKKGEMGVGG